MSISDFFLPVLLVALVEVSAVMIFFVHDVALLLLFLRLLVKVDCPSSLLLLHDLLVVDEDDERDDFRLILTDVLVFIVLPLKPASKQPPLSCPNVGVKVGNRWGTEKFDEVERGERNIEYRTHS